MKKNIGRLIAFFLATLFLLTGCGKSEVDKSLSGEIVCITKDVFYEVAEGETSTLQAIVNNFAVFYPNVKVTINLVTNDEDFIPEVLGALKSETPPDIIIASPDEMNSILESSNSPLLDISDILVKENTPEESSSSDSEVIPEEKLSESIISLSKLKGLTPVYYPISISANLMAFNKNILDSVAMTDKLPSSEDRTWTFEEYKAFILELSEKLPLDVDTGILFYGTKDGSSASKNLISNAYSSNFKTDGNLTINSETGLNGLLSIKEILDSNAMINGFTVDLSENIDKFIQGEIAHTIYYNLGFDLNYKKDKKDDFQTIFVPYPSSSQPKLSYSALGASITATDENKQVISKAFLDFLGDTDGFSDYIVGSAGMYSPKSEHNEFLKDEYAFLSRTTSMLGNYPFPESQNHESQWIFMLRKVMFLDEDPKEALDFFVANSEEFVFSKSEEEPAKTD